MIGYPKINSIWAHKNSGEIFIVGPKAKMNDGSHAVIAANMSDSERGFEIWLADDFLKIMKHQSVTQDDIISMLKEKANAK